MNEATQSALIVGGFGFAGVIGTAILNYLSNRKVKETVGVLAKNIDGAMTEIKQTIAAKNLAEGQLKGIADEQARAADLITEPAQVHEALNGKDVREQISNIEKSVLDAGDAATAVAADLARSRERADAKAGGKPGAAADAAMQTPEKK